MFTRALAEIFSQSDTPSTIYAVDKNPHALWSLHLPASVSLEIIDADFHLDIPLPPLDGILMANALHYARDHVQVLHNVLQLLKPGGTFVLVEYDTEHARPPWIPHPVSFSKFHKLASQVFLTDPREIGSMASSYGHNRLYAAVSVKAGAAGLRQ